MPDYIVTAATIKRDGIEGKYGTMRDITLTLVPSGGEVSDPVIASWYTKATTDVPSQGTVLTGDITDGEYGKKFKKAQAPGGFGGGGPRPEDPKRQAMIIRQHSQTAAVSLLDLMTRLGVVKVESKADAFQAYVGIVDWLDTDAKKAGDAA